MGGLQILLLDKTYTATNKTMTAQNTAENKEATQHTYCKSGPCQSFCSVKTPSPHAQNFQVIGIFGVCPSQGRHIQGLEKNLVQSQTKDLPHTHNQQLGMFSFRARSKYQCQDTTKACFSDVENHISAKSGFFRSFAVLKTWFQPGLFMAEVIDGKKTKETSLSLSLNKAVWLKGGFE